MWDVNNLKKIEEFENLDYWTLVKIAEIANRDDEFQSALEEEHSELKEAVSELEDEVSGLESDNSELQQEVEEMEDVLRDCYMSKNMDEVKKHIESYDENHPYRHSFWTWLDKNK